MASHGDRFRRRALSRGYKVDEVDAFLDRVEATLAGEPVGSPVTADEVDDVVFRVRFGGYDEWQVDVYLDRVARQLAELEDRGVLGSAPAPDFGKPESTGSVPAAPAPRREAGPPATQVIPSGEMMAAREGAPPPPVREAAGRGSRAAAPDPEGFSDLRGDDDGEGFGFLAGPPDDDYEDPFAKPPSGADRDFGGAPEPPGPAGEFGPPRGGDFGPPHREPSGPPMHDGPQAGSSPHGATQQLPLQSDPRRGAVPPPAEPGRGFGPPNEEPPVPPGAGGVPPGRRAAPEPAPGFGAAYDDDPSNTGGRPAMPPQGPSSQPPMPPPGQQPTGPSTGPIPQPQRQSPPQGPPPQPPGGPPHTAPIPQPVPPQRPDPPPAEPPPYGAPRGRPYGRDGAFPAEPAPGQHEGFAHEAPGPEDAGFGRRAAPPSPPPPAGGFGAPAGAPPGPGDNGAFGPPPGPGAQQRGAAAPPDFGRRNPYEGRSTFEAPSRHGREEMTTEMRASDSPFTPDDIQRLEQLRRAFQPRRFGSGYDPAQVDQMFDAVSAAMTGRNPVPLADRELDTSQFSLVQGGYFEAEVDSALREVRELFARRGMMH
nr:DivIVA domain-containing protein [Glycomyces xiaoerkulensis]